MGYVVKAQVCTGGRGKGGGVAKGAEGGAVAGAGSRRWAVGRRVSVPLTASTCL